ncbi:MAG: biosynthetic-type acetolactate synthase large subunit, partial [Anaerolineae bacterium]|nr:biosynthetic-type acetolactate synthase large subunit [Anaerolineae bacterium]
MRLSGAQIVWEMLEREGVEVVFGLPGGAIIDTYHCLQEYNIRHVLVRHEQGAAHAADGYARASGRVGVAVATSGPGATNLVTGIATAMMDSSPMVCITGQVSTSLIGSDAFQEADVTGITLPITKHNYLVTDVDELAGTIREAFHIARSGRPGPVLIDLPKDVQQAKTDFVPPNGELLLPGYQLEHRVDGEQIREAADMLNSAERPVVLVGHGILMSDTTRILRELVERMEAPVALTLLGKGAFPASHPLCLGMMGMHGEAFANQAIQEADLLLALGMRFDDRVTGSLEHYAPKARKIHIDADAAELNKIVPADVAILGDLRQVLAELLPAVERARHPEWLERIGAWRGQSRARDILNQPQNGRLVAPRVIDALWEETQGDALVVTDVGQHQMWTALYYELDRPNPLITSGGLGTMGFALPAAIGAQIAQPDREVWAVVGDGGFQMTIQELGTLVQEGLPVKIALVNNSCLGMVRQWQEMFYDGRYESTYLVNPDFVRLAEAYGIPAFRVKEPKDTVAAIAAARRETGPALIEFEVAREGEDGNVYPIVPPG